MPKKNRYILPTKVDFTLVSKALAVVSGKWRLYIILLVGEQTLRYSELHAQLPGISEKMLAGELKALVELGVLHRKIYAEIPPRVEYSITQNGRMALPILYQLQEIGRIFN